MAGIGARDAARDLAPRRGRRTAQLHQLAGVWRRPRANPLLRPQGDQPVERQPSPDRMDVRLGRDRRPPDQSDRRRRRALHDDAEAQGRGARRRDRHPALEVRFGHRGARAEPRRHVLVERRRGADLLRAGNLHVRARRAHRKADRVVRQGRPRRSPRRARPRSGDAIGPADHAGRRLQGSGDRRRAGERRAAGIARRHPRLRRAHGRAALDVPHHPAARRVWLRHLAEGRVDLHRRRQQLGWAWRSTRRAASSTCRPDPRRPISTAPTGTATTSSPIRWSRSTRRPAGASGISRRCTTTSGIAIFRRRRAW